VREALRESSADDGHACLLRTGYRFALSLTHDPSRAEDLLQDAWVSVLKAGGPRVAPYLITAIRSRFVDQQRRALIAPMESIDAGSRPSVEAEGGFWEDPCDLVAIRMTLHRALGLLRPAERAVVVLSAVEGYTAREISEMLDAPRGTILSLMHRARAKLRRSITSGADQEATR
jgi:RNA polymerase sigma-70 factor (ECF subfamily)